MNDLPFQSVFDEPKTPILVFDFDGVLHAPPFKGDVIKEPVLSLIPKLAKSHTLCIASFNWEVRKHLREHQLEEYFSAVRASSNDDVVVKCPRGQQKPDEWFKCSKHEQILSMQKQCFPNVDLSQVIFFDDEDYNHRDVEKHLPSVKRVLIGFCESHKLTKELVDDVLIWYEQTKDKIQTGTCVRSKKCERIDGIYCRIHIM